MDKSKKIFILVSLILVTVIANFVIFSMQQSKMGGGKIENTYLGPMGETIYVDESEFATSQNNTLLIAGVSSVIVLILITLIVVSVSSSKKQKKYDEQRKTDIAQIAQGLERFYIDHKQYPLSQSYSPEHYSGINLTTDWEYYNFPSKEVMQNYIPGWPLYDPSVNPKAKSQTNNYIYFPRNQGQAFDLYAHLDSPDKQTVVDYNAQDQLPKAWGSFNYKVSNQQHAAADQPSLSTTEPTATPAEQPTSSPQASPLPTMQPTPIEANPVAVEPAIQLIPTTELNPTGITPNTTPTPAPAPPPASTPTTLPSSNAQPAENEPTLENPVAPTSPDLSQSATDNTTQLQPEN